MSIEEIARAITSTHILAFLLAREAAAAPKLLDTLHSALIDHCTQDAEKHVDSTQTRAQFVRAISVELGAVFFFATRYQEIMTHP